MRILHVIASIDPKFGGTTEAVRLLQTYGPADYFHEVVTIDDPGSSFLRDLEDVGIAAHALGPARSTYSYSARLVPWLRANRECFDGVIVHGMWQYCGRAVRRTMRGRVPYVVFPHGMLDPYFKRAFPRKHLKKWIYWLTEEYWVLRDAYRVLFTCEAEARLAKQTFWLHRWIPYIANFGSVRPEGDEKAQGEAFFAVCPNVRGRRYLLFLGRIDPKKGCDLLIDAFVKTADGDPALNLVMAGPDGLELRPALERSALAAGLGERIHWPGMLQGDAKWGAFRGAEAFCLPSHQENFGIAVAEALACGKPVLLSDKVNIASEIAQDGAGLVESDTAGGTARLLERWIAMGADEREAMSARALECFGERYDMRENAKKTMRLFERPLKQEGR